jgi:type I restriction-modification system DNA methylase subunit
MNKNIKKQNDYEREFLRKLETIDRSRDPLVVFRDWLVASSASLYCWKRDASVENEYFEAARLYSKKQLLIMSELLDIVINALDKTESDFLGNIFMEIKTSNRRNGQFFTPNNVSDLIAEINIGEIEDPERIITISDPCCGSGSMLMAVAKTLKNRNHNFQKNAFFVAKDIDSDCCYMSFIQFSILGMPAHVICGNSITESVTWQRKTFFYYFNDIGERLYEQNKSESTNNNLSVNKEVKDFLELRIVPSDNQEII